MKIIIRLMLLFVLTLVAIDISQAEKNAAAKTDCEQLCQNQYDNTLESNLVAYDTCMYVPNNNLSQCEEVADTNRWDCLDYCQGAHTGCMLACDYSWSTEMQTCYNAYVSSMTNCDNQHIIADNNASYSFDSCLNLCP
ncbi:MAG: hypothetical protein ACK5NT_07025 [Pyrinomonadaceae bacterium]